MDTTKLEIEALEGIGEGIGTLLRAADIDYVCDLLAVPESYVSGVVAGVASSKQVQGWRSMAQLLLCEPMDPQWAEALVEARVIELGQLLEQSLDDLTSLFDEAVAAGRIPSSPSTSELFEMIKSAALVHSGARLMGRVVDADGAGVADATVVLGRVETSTNAAGTFVVTGLDAGATHLLTVVAEGFEDLVVQDAPAGTDDWDLVVATYTLTPGTSEPQVSDEYDGDELPSASSYASHQEILGPEFLRPDEPVFVSRFYVNGDVKLTSVCRSFERGRLTFRSYRMPPETVPEGLGEGECLTWSDGTFRSHGTGSFLASRLRALHRRRRLREAHAAGLEGLSPFERVAEAERLAREAMTQED
ncbi:MAG: carboxypeptidase-like regulatory domain-containing protein [Planctomycetota bacterium]|nr:carboxypeptidase-like regulatory domain-containing protein [Planctomycetota bacterium]